MLEWYSSPPKVRRQVRLGNGIEFLRPFLEHRAGIGVKEDLRNLNEGVEFLVVTEWASLEAIQQFAGDDVERAVVPAAVREMMLEYDQVVLHYDIIE
jgi:heme-degrading monooxygenase HmoA